MTLVFELNEAARVCVKPEYAGVLKSAAAILQAAISNFGNWPTRDNMTILNGAWSYAERVLKECPPMPEAGPNGARMQVAA